MRGLPGGTKGHIKRPTAKRSVSLAAGRFLMAHTDFHVDRQGGVNAKKWSILALFVYFQFPS